MSNKIYRTHEQDLRIVYNDTSSNCIVLLLKGKSVPVHLWHFQLLMLKIYERILILNTCFVKRLFVQRNMSNMSTCDCFPLSFREA